MRVVLERVCRGNYCDYTRFACFINSETSMDLIFRFAICVSLLTFGTCALAAEKDGESALTLIVTAKFAGGCGIISQMATFQQSTEMTGGEAFLERFLSTESARLGMTPKQYLEQCRRSNEIYQSYYDELEKTPAP